MNEICAKLFIKLLAEMFLTCASSTGNALRHNLLASGGILVTMLCIKPVTFRLNWVLLIDNRRTKLQSFLHAMILL